MSTPTLRGKPVFLTGTALVLAGFLFSALDHVLRVTLCLGYYESSVHLTTPFFAVSYTGYPTFWSMSSILDGSWLMWAVDAVIYYVLPAVGTVIAFAAVILLGVYLIKGYRTRRNILLSAALGGLSAATVWNAVCLVVGFFSSTSTNECWKTIPYIRSWDMFLAFLNNLWVMIERHYMQDGFLSLLYLLIGVLFLIAAIALPCPRVGKGISAAGIAAASVTAVICWAAQDPLVRGAVWFAGRFPVIWPLPDFELNSGMFCQTVYTSALLLMCALCIVLILTSPRSTAAQRH